MPERSEEAARDRLDDRQAGDDLHRDDAAADEHGQVEEERREHEPAADPEESRKEGCDESRERGDRLVRHRPYI